MQGAPFFLPLPPMNYKPFDLEAAKAGKPIVCRNGEPAKFIAYVPESVRPVVFLVRSTIGSNASDGRENNAAIEASWDLFMLPERKTVWVNVYPGSHDTRTEADKYATKARIACFEVTYEEGQGL